MYEDIILCPGPSPKTTN